MRNKYNFKVLFVEDEKRTREEFAEILNERFDHVDLATNGAEGLQLYKELKHDLVISDILMPVMSGLSMVQQIKSLNPKQNVIFTTAHSESEFFLQAFKLRVRDYLIKPIDVREFDIILKDIFVELSFEKEMKIKTKELDEYKKILEESDIVSKADPSGNITYVNKKFMEVSGYEEDELIGRPHNLIRHPEMPGEEFVKLWKTISHKKIYKGIIKNKKKDGTPYYVDATIVPILDIDGNIKEYIGLRHDITDIMNPKKQFLDDLSNVENPLAVMMKIENYVLLKNFYGEAYMHKVEEMLSKKLHDLLPSYSEIDKIYHIDNGEYCFFRDIDISQLEDVRECLEDYRKNIAHHEFMVDKNKVEINLIFCFTRDRDEAFENLKIGIHEAQKNKLKILNADSFSKKSKATAQNNFQIVEILKHAIKYKGTSVISYFQPVMCNKTHEIEKYESLVRIIKQNGEMLTPYFFLDIAKKSGFYTELTHIIIENTFKMLDMSDKKVTINLSTLDIENVTVRNKLLSLLTDKNYFGRVVFELLEDESANDFGIVKDFISTAKVVGGVQIAIDDFGSGYSNFERLLDFQPDILKIDGSLIKNIVENQFSQHVVESIVVFAKKQNIKTVAEFVSDQSILNKVKELGIDYSQGYFIGKPSDKLVDEK